MKCEENLEGDAVLDTSILIDKIRRGEEIHDSISEVSVLEYPPVLKCGKFFGRIYFVQRRDFELALHIQISLRKIGKPKPIPDLIISATCINRDDELITKDEDFLDIASVSDLRVRMVE